MRKNFCVAPEPIVTFKRNSNWEPLVQTTSSTAFAPEQITYSEFSPCFEDQKSFSFPKDTCMATESPLKVTKNNFTP